MNYKTIEIKKNNKTYFYSIPEYNIDYYEKISNFLAELDIDRGKVNARFCSIYSKKRILTKIKNFFKNKKIEYYGIDKFDNTYIYSITLFNDEEWSKYRLGWKIPKYNPDDEILKLVEKFKKLEL